LLFKQQSMKKFFLFLFIIVTKNSFSATGSAYDGIVFIGAILAFMLLLLATSYLIDFIVARIKEARIKRVQRKDSEANNEKYDDLCLSHPV
jgi:hypothetical protein